MVGEDATMANPSSAETLDARIATALKTVRRPRPKLVRPIVVIGAGGIVRAAHLPASEKAGFPVIGLLDRDKDKAAALAAERGISHSLGSLAEAVSFAPRDAVFDIAVPASELVQILWHLPDGATALIQKPMGETLSEARRIRDICRANPNNLAVAALANCGLLGEIHDIEIQTSTYTPWHLWTFLASAPRLEILYHSIHYFDLIRSWLGDPQGVYARTEQNPHTANLAATKTIAILNYGNAKRVFVATNHHHNFGPEHQHSFVQWEGLDGAARITMGVNLDYPTGKADSAEYAPRRSNASGWRQLPITGNNFPDAFMGTMGALQSFAEGSASTLPSHFEDAFHTMALVEALYRSSERPGEPLLENDETFTVDD